MSSNVLALTNQEIEQCRTAFQQFDRDSSGTIDSNELKETLEAMGQHPTDEEVFSMLNLIDDNGSGTCDFSEFLKVILDQKLQQLDVDGELDTIAAFVAMGGNEDKSGVITSEKLSKTIKDFELLIDIDQLISQTDRDNSGYIDYMEFKSMLAEC
mmetsp:Transcript_42711/g.71274  ORF Transcript_42711/g.71274 Transcript_42711/m.71274 type:complete len:155 (-) Transcript_42711:56-520(-)|eukprot:CAMPEP_0198210448 /NCGR_PEP_ID=MMETSP1445-20131203/20112_1 /TAXON_ID=36898 /ORGANISM="Pyramimonas sp., Strain CCMP2087" /LENGTH=154 /DNA_ID=CAMNT_0043884511 /DNA_START=114 /DNA_END=578 /DNA_ORIENTATION=+